MKLHHLLAEVVRAAGARGNWLEFLEAGDNFLDVVGSNDYPGKSLVVATH
jgi:hypothetical protein